MLVALLLPSVAQAADTAYLSKLIGRAHREHLAERPEWRALVHYRPRRFSGGVESAVDAPSFFLSHNGKRDPQAELDATLTAFFAPAPDPEKSAQCTFVARYQWLKGALGFDPKRLPVPSCRRFHRWLKALNPYRLTLVFPAAYLNNPPSMFGHTLLRVDTREQDEQTRLLAYTINYAARSHRQRGIGFAFKGLFGMYHGGHSIAPYYLKVKEYSDIENRDIWEYRLNLDAEEIDRLLRHVWELQSAWFDYYFLDENCSYNLLSLLDAARPGLHLTDRFSLWVIPSETIRAVIDAGLVDSVRFRPARNTILRERAERMAGRRQLLAKRLTLGELRFDAEEMTRLAPEERAQVIDLALDYAVYRNNVRFSGGEQDPVTITELLAARSRLEVPDQTPDVPLPAVWPGRGHKPARASLGYGFEDRRQFLEIAAAPGYHDLFDPQGGFTPGSRVMALGTALRYYPQEEKIELERFDLLDIMSLSPWGQFLHPVAWTARMGLARKHPAAADRVLVGQIDGGVGICRALSVRTTAFALAQGALELSGRFAHFAAPGAGPAIGLLHDVSERWRTGLLAHWWGFPLGDARSESSVSLRNRWELTRQNVVGLDLSWKNDWGHDYLGGKMYWQIYF